MENRGPLRRIAAVTSALGVCGVAVALALGPAGSAPGPGDYLTYHGNVQRTGWYQAETTLTPANVGSTSFGLTGSYQVPGKVYAQPLYVTNETIGGTAHNLVIIATSTDQVYAVDDKTNQPVWHRSFTGGSVRQQLWNDFKGGAYCYDVSPDIGITGTPVVDRALDRLFVVAATKDGASFHLRIHALSLQDGKDVPGAGPTEVSDKTGDTAGALVDPLYNFQRAALLESKGNVYVSLAGHCDWNTRTTHGWVLSYSAASLKPTGNLNTVHVSTVPPSNGTPYFLGAPWMAGFGPAADAAGNVYFATGNGAFDGKTSFAMSIMKVPATLDMTGASYFYPASWKLDTAQDDDLGSGGVMLLPDQQGAHPHLLVTGGKCSAFNGTGAPCTKYMLDRDHLGGMPPPAAPPVPLWSADTAGPMRGGPAYFALGGQQYVVYGGGPPRGRGFKNPLLSTYQLVLAPQPMLTPVAVASYSPGCLQCREGGSQPVVSSNPAQPTHPIVWVVQTPDTNGYPMFGGGGIPLKLFAFDAMTMQTLFSGVAASGKWALAPTPGGTPFPGQWEGAAMVSPLVAGGKVYVPLQDAVAVFGLKASPGASPAPPVVLPGGSAVTTFALAQGRAAASPRRDVTGTIAAKRGTSFALKVATGGQMPVDASAAFRSGAVSAELFAGQRVLVTGTMGSDGVLHAVSVQRSAPPAQY